MPNLCCCVAPKPPADVSAVEDSFARQAKNFEKQQTFVIRSFKGNNDAPTRFATYLSEEQQEELVKVANALVAPGKGILASDESVATMSKRLSSVNIANTEENRRHYRELLFTTDSELAHYISGVLLFDETFRQKTTDGVPFVTVLKEKGIIPGIKVDRGNVPLAGTENECTTQGLDGLAERLAEYKRGGCGFAKWRSVLKVSDSTPSYLAMTENANAVARFASICQQFGLVPIVEPEVLPDGNHDLETTQKVTEMVLAHQYKALADHHVFLEGTLLRPNMVTAGTHCQIQYSYFDIGKATVRTLQRTVPPAVAGVAFLSGGQSEKDATMNLNEINLVTGRKPWPLTFSYGRALQHSVLKMWAGHEEKFKDCQHELLRRAQSYSDAATGRHSVEVAP